MPMQVNFYRTSSGRVPVREFIDFQPVADQAKFWSVFQGIRQYGLDCPNVKFRQLTGKLWEIKYSSLSGGYRIAYVVLKEGLMVWLHAFKKTSRKTPQNDLDIAIRRMKEVLEHEQK